MDDLRKEMGNKFHVSNSSVTIQSLKQRRHEGWNLTGVNGAFTCALLVVNAPSICANQAFIELKFTEQNHRLVLQITALKKKQMPEEFELKLIKLPTTKRIDEPRYRKNSRRFPPAWRRRAPWRACSRRRIPRRTAIIAPFVFPRTLR